MPRRTHLRNRLARGYSISGLNKKALRVSIQSTPAVGVFDHHHVAVAFVSTRKNYRARGGRFDRGTAFSRNVDALVKSHAAINRIATHTKLGSNCTLQW
jgi:hypothetical protein